MKKFIILGVVIVGMAAIAVGFLCLTNLEEATTLIQEGDSLFEKKEFTKAKQCYQLSTWSTKMVNIFLDNNQLDV